MQPLGRGLGGLDGERLERVAEKVLARVLELLGAGADPLARRREEERDRVGAAPASRGRTKSARQSRSPATWRGKVKHASPPPGTATCSVLPSDEASKYRYIARARIQPAAWIFAMTASSSASFGSPASLSFR